jgi:hypothetical protein
MATAVDAVLHTPPGKALVITVAAPKQTVPEPDIKDGNGCTVTVVAEKHPVGNT